MNGGEIVREMAVGNDRLDMLAKFKKQEFALEIKIKRDKFLSKKVRSNWPIISSSMLSVTVTGGEFREDTHFFTPQQFIQVVDNKNREVFFLKKYYNII
ncbi:MAG TPA: hypothetical protein VK186_23315 [Candidatus Deferrimicrobium sp.]|nr:hypothetical protein [Candidatus Deferrimicrobium sp.]